MRWEPEVSSAASHWGSVYGVTIDPALVHGILERESRHGTDANYVAHGGVVPDTGGHTAYGPMQVLDDTVRSLNATLDPRALAQSPALGIWYGTHYLALLLKKFPGDTARAIAAYNAGPGNSARNSAGRFVNQSYVDFVLAYMRNNPAASVLPLLALGAGLVILWQASRRSRRAA